MYVADGYIEPTYCPGGQAPSIVHQEGSFTHLFDGTVKKTKPYGDNCGR